MALLMSFLIAMLAGTGFYMMMRRQIVKIIIGLTLLSHAANLIVFSMSGTFRGNPPVLRGAEPAGYADPLPQALILTSIVIGFGLLSFVAVLLLRAFEALGSDDLRDVRGMESEEGAEKE